MFVSPAERRRMDPPFAGHTSPNMAYRQERRKLEGVRKNFLAVGPRPARRGTRTALPTPSLGSRVAAAAAAIRQRLVGAVLLAQPALLHAQVVGSHPQAVAPNGCETATITEIRSEGEDLRIGASAPLEARITRMERLDDEGFAPFHALTLEFPGAAPARDVPRFSSWEKGPIASARVGRYRTDRECGTRIRVEARRLGEWALEKRGRRVFLTSRLAPGRAATVVVEGGSGRGPSAGAVRVATMGTTLRQTGPGWASNGQLQVGMSQRVPAAGTLRAFASFFGPGERSNSPYGAVALSGVSAGLALIDVASGDLETSLGDIQGAAPIFPNTLLIRGGGATIFLPKGFAIQAFAGRAAFSRIYRLPDLSGTISDVSDDRVYGVQGAWIYPTGRFGLGFGATRSVPVGAPERRNFFGSVAFQDGSRRALELLLETSRGEENGRRISGWAATIQPSVSTESATLSGYYRHASPDSRPTLGTSFFAGLREVANLNASYRPTRALGLFASANEGKSFNYFDPADVGTLTTSGSAGVSYAFRPWLTASLFQSASKSVSDPGAMNPTDGRTESTSASLGFRASKLDNSISFSRETTRGFEGRSLDMTSRRMELSSRLGVGRSDELSGRFRYDDSRRSDGSGAGKNYRGEMEYRASLDRFGVLAGNLEFGVTPAGVSLHGSRQVTASVGYQPRLPGSSRNQLSCRVSYYRTDLDNGPSHSAWIAQVSVGTLLGWGSGPRPSASAESRAMPMALTRHDELEQAVVDVHVFEDRNGDGAIQPGEPGIPGARVELGGGCVVTDGDGFARARLAEGKYTARLLAQGPALDFFVPSAVRALTVSRLEHRSLAFALRPACRITGRVMSLADPAGAPYPEGIRVTASGMGVARETVTGKGGAFEFGLLPEGSHQVTLDVASLADGTVVDGPASFDAQCRKEEGVVVSFTTRKETARERFLVK
jgi:hypothetical protein